MVLGCTGLPCFLGGISFDASVGVMRSLFMDILLIRKKRDW
jgi:hypothetical protein